MPWVEFKTVKEAQHAPDVHLDAASCSCPLRLGEEIQPLGCALDGVVPDRHGLLLLNFTQEYMKSKACR